MTMLTNIHGTVHGRTIKLDQELSVPDGESVTMTIVLDNAASMSKPSRSSLEAAAGALAGLDEEIDEFNRWYREARRVDRAPLEPLE